MGVINQLDSVIYNRISAGEVVERPFSVVKEIVENAIDAGANRITIEIIEGGRERISISDNGIGMAQEDLRPAFLPHATSKIKNVADLDNIATLGFRGEALASIASVAIVEMQSKQTDSVCGNYIKLEGGTIKEEKPVNMADGTVITVSNLFFNTPARAKFLKKSKSEEHDISKLIIDLILANPNIAISYSADGKLIFNSTGRGLEDAVYSVYSKEITNNLLKVKYNDNGYRINGYISAPKYTKPTRAYQTTIINGRIINNVTVTTAVTQAYGESLMRRNFPIFIMDIVMPFNDLDVNVTPNKTDVRFVDAKSVFSNVYRAVKETLERERKIFTLNTTNDNLNNFNNDIANSFYNNSIEQNCNDNKAKANNYYNYDTRNLDTEIACSVNTSCELNKEILSIGENGSRDNSKIIFNNDNNTESSILTHDVNDNKNDLINKINKQIINLSSQNSVNAANFFNVNSLSDSGESHSSRCVEQMRVTNTDNESQTIKIIGQIFKTYLLVTDGVYAYIIDQHAAHERMIYDKLVMEIETNYIASQVLLMPQIVELNPIDAEFINGIIDDLQGIGLEIEEFGNCSFKITAIPSIFGGFNFNNYIDEIIKSKRTLQQIKIKNLMRDKLAVTACKAAIKAGEELTECEIQALITMMKDGLPLQCPHGRPAIIRIERKDIDKIFKRII